MSTMGMSCSNESGAWAAEVGCFLAAGGPLTILGAVLILGGIAVFLLRRRDRRQYFEADPPFLFASIGAPAVQLRPEWPPPPPSGPEATEKTERPAPPLPDKTERPAPPPSQGRSGRAWADRVSAGPVQFDQPADGTLQLLPGRLEIRAGPAAGQEIRFVRVPGEAAEVTIGRSSGPLFRHVQLESPTVSRMHARLRFSGGRWTLANESKTNPTLLNGRALDQGSKAAPLTDGDRIEMGEISFVFRQPEGVDRLSYRSSWHTDRGRRGSNQDAVAVRTLSDGRELAVVCDGMGGHAGGERASHVALESLLRSLEAGGGLEAAVHDAHRAVREEAERDEAGTGMGTTLVALLRTGERYELVNVGDSRAYRIDADGVHQISEDHSFVAQVVQDGRMTRDEALRSPWRNAITRHLGAEGSLEVDHFGPYSASESHLVLLCSDGVHSVLPDEAIRTLVGRSSDLADLAREIGEEALRAGSEDNVTAVVVRFARGLEATTESERVAGSPTRPGPTSGEVGGGRLAGA